MIKPEEIWQVIASYTDGTTKEFFPTDNDTKLKTRTGYLNAKVFTNKDAYRIGMSQAGDNVSNLQVMPVKVTYDTKTKQVLRKLVQNDESIDLQSENTPPKLGSLFEKKVNSVLHELFDDVKYNVSMEGHSGQIWQIDFVVDNSLILEVSIEKRSEIKVNTTFLKFVDLARKHPNYKFALLFETPYKKIYGRPGMEKTDHLYRLAPHKTFIAFGFTILTLDDVRNLIAFAKGIIDAYQCSKATR